MSCSQMLLNYLTCLDKGYVALFDSTCNFSKLADLYRNEVFKTSTPLRSFGSMTLLIKCPLFVQLNLSRFAFKITTADNLKDVEAYIPSGPEVGSPDRQLSNDIADDIERTTKALLINPLAYQKDGADRFTSQITSPINIYTTLLVQGNHDEWVKYTNQQDLPGQIKIYVDNIKQILEAEWK